MMPKPEQGSSRGSFFFQKTLLAILLIAACILTGLFSLDGMVKEDIPDLKIPQAIVETEWPGADPKTMEQQVTKKLEEKIKSLDGLKRMRSSSFNSFSVVVVEFEADMDLDESIRTLRESVQDAVPKLPKGAKRPKITKASVNETPVMTVGLFGDIPPNLLGDTAWKLKEELLKIRGVNKVNINGRRKDVIHVRMINSRLGALNIAPQKVVRAIQEASIDMPWERIDDPHLALSLRLEGRFRSLKDLKELPVAKIGERRVFLREVAEVRRDLEMEKAVIRMAYPGKEFRPCLTIDVKKSPGADTVRLIDAAKEKVAKFRESAAWPQSLEHKITSDQSITIMDNLMSVFHNGWQAMLCVFVVLLFALTWREALIAGLSIPITFLGALCVIWGLGYTLNQLVIIGMVLALGLLVDDFILMMEGMHDNLTEKKLSLPDAQRATVKQYAVPSFSGSLTTIMVFIPLMAIGGEDGKFIRLIPVTAAICLILSYAVSLLIDIPMSKYLLRPTKAGSKPGMGDRVSNLLSSWFDGWLKRTVLGGRLRAAAWVGSALLLLALSVTAAGYLPVLLYPKADGRNLGITIRMRPETVLERADELRKRICSEIFCEKTESGVVWKKDFIESIVAYAGQMSPMARSNIADALIPEKEQFYVSFSCMLTPKSDRERLGFAYLPELRKEIEPLLEEEAPGSRLTFTIDGGGPSTADPVQVELAGEDMNTLRRLSAQVREALLHVPGAVDVKDNLGPPRMDIAFKPNREALNFYGLPLEELAQQVRYAVSSEKIGDYPVTGAAKEDLEIRASYAWGSRNGLPGGPRNWSEAEFIRAFVPNGESVPLPSLLKYNIGASPIAITHADGERAVVVSCQTAGRAPADLFADLEKTLKEKEKEWPAGYAWRFKGEAESSAETYGSTSVALMIAILLVFAILALQFDSFSQPLIILTALPFSMTGVFSGFFLFGIPFSFPAMIGVISLVGIAVNDAIVLIDTMNGFRKEGLSIVETAARGACARLRPILVTTITTIAGLTPLALSDPLWMPLCTAIIFGICAATVISLVIIPAMYLLLVKPIEEAEIVIV